MCVVVHETCTIIIHKLVSSFPTGDEVSEVVRGFKEKWGFPQCVGSVNVSHIPDTSPSITTTIEKGGIPLLYRLYWTTVICHILLIIS